MAYIKKGSSSVKGKYNLWALAKDEGLSITEIQDLLKVHPSLLANYRTKMVSQQTADKIEEFVLSVTDTPEKYEFDVCPYIPTRGRKIGSLNKNSGVRHIPVIKKNFGELKNLVKESQEKYFNESQEENFQVKSCSMIKINLKDFQEILDALENGEKVYQEDSNYSFEKYNDSIIRFCGEEPVFIGPSLDLKQKYYYFKIPPLELKINKSYILKNKTKCLINFIDEEASEYIGIFQGSDRYIKYTKDGKVKSIHRMFNTVLPECEDLGQYEILGEAI